MKEFIESLERALVAANATIRDQAELIETLKDEAKKEESHAGSADTVQV